ncbi:MBL fold metallo-hydrolase [Spirulina subsalsa FACHB-351]|uniref:MBL fold metallo-hydrolase n=2 Tax=Spirulina subsalsa TaxID=54311 RepID=A0ABT3L3H4_9CYAN|nr:MBL fold metallo-hydrolase [Spirulina subsalsa]MCW6036038.1 MBL fold metallo-hydrolase [Spirulina subsalsa FACHB-351]
MMKRRQLIRYAGASVLTGASIIGMSSRHSVEAQSNSPTSNNLTVRWFGHTCFLFTGEGLRILVNPFRSIGCTAGYPAPAVPADLVLISSQLFDEGAAEIVPNNPLVFFEPGSFQFRGRNIQGIAIAHDREGGRRFGTNVTWSWTQGGIRILHLGGAAAPIEIEQQILMGRPDLLLVPVGGGPKAYNAQEALRAIQTLQPKLVIPTHYRTSAADESTCDISPLSEFLQVASAYPVSQVGSNTLQLSPGNLPTSGTAIRVMRT